MMYLTNQVRAAPEARGMAQPSAWASLPTTWRRSCALHQRPARLLVRPRSPSTVAPLTSMTTWIIVTCPQLQGVSCQMFVSLQNHSHNFFLKAHSEHTVLAHLFFLLNPVNKKRLLYLCQLNSDEVALSSWPHFHYYELSGCAGEPLTTIRKWIFFILPHTTGYTLWKVTNYYK